MSRCFPFPPPGYEIKTRCDDASLITKFQEKWKKKSHKEKGEEDKNVRGSTKENRRSENKHKDDKDPNKKKHRDKKHKKDKKKHERRSSEEKKTFENQDGQKLNPHRKNCNGIQGDKFLDEMVRRIRNDGEAENNEMFWKVDLRAAPEDGSNVILAESYRNIKDKKELTTMDDGGNLKGNARCLGHDMVGNLLEENQNRIMVDAGSCQLDKDGNGKKGKEKSKEQNSAVKVDVPKNEDRDNNRKGKVCGEEKIKQRPEFPEVFNNNSKNLLMAHPNSQGKHPLLIEPVSNESSHKNGYQANNPAKAALSGHQVTQNGTSLHPSQNSANSVAKTGDFTKNQKVGAKLLSSQAINKNVENTETAYSANKSTADNRRASVIFGGKTEQHWPSNGMAKVEPIVNSHNAGGKFPEECSLIENGRKEVGSDIEGHKMNGMLGCKTDTALKPLSNKKVGTPVKPHPDLKYLSQILTVPGLEWSQFDDQEWLFGRINSRAKKPKLASTPISVINPVWTDAMRVESVDVIAMPYVRAHYFYQVSDNNRTHDKMIAGIDFLYEFATALKHRSKGCMHCESREMQSIGATN